MQIVNLRHPGYHDSCNIIITLQAPDDPNGGIHAETFRLAGCILAGNRWDAFLSITQKDPEPAGSDDGILRRKDYYLHIPEGSEVSEEDLVIDRRKDRTGPFPITARFADWSFPIHGLPALWQITADVIARKAEEAKDNSPVDEDGDPLDKNGCRLCGQSEETKWEWLWNSTSEWEHKIFEREQHKLGIEPALDADYSSGEDDKDEDDDNDNEDDDDDNDADDDDADDSDRDDEDNENDTDVDEDEDEDEDEVEDEDGDEDEDEDNCSQRHSISRQNEAEPNDEETAEKPGTQWEHEAEGANDEGLASTKPENDDDLTESADGDDTPEAGGDNNDDPLDDNRNMLRIGLDCSANSYHCESAKSHGDFQWLFVPKFEDTGEPVMSAHIFATREDGISDAHNKPLLFPWKSSIELLFAHFAQATFEQLGPFFERNVERAVRVVDESGTTLLLDANEELCKALIVPLSRSRWPEKVDEVEEADSTDSEAEEDNGAQDDKGMENTASPEDQTLAEIHPSNEAFQRSLKELMGQLGDVSLAPDQEKATIPEISMRRAFPNVVCDECDQAIYDVRYICLGCDDYDLCSDCIISRGEEQATHHFLPIYDTPWFEWVPTGAMVPKPEQEDAENSSDSGGENEEPAEGVLSASETASRLAAHLAFGGNLRYRDALYEDSGDRPKIRLLSLWPGSGEDPLLGHLDTYELDQAPLFEALSYCWGRVDPSYTINISSEKLEVTENLKLALFRLRNSDAVRRLWIDGICINQQDATEKTAQVKLMRDIYQKAHRTVVWLGEEDPETRLAFNLCARQVSAHGNVYLKQSMGVDIEGLYDAFISADGKEASKDQQSMAEFSVSFNMDQAIFNHGYEAALAAMQGQGYDGPYKAMVDNVLARKTAEVVEASTEEEELPENLYEHFQEVGRRVAAGEEYNGPFKELVYEAVAEAQAELEAEAAAEDAANGVDTATNASGRGEDSDDDNTREDQALLEEVADTAESAVPSNFHQDVVLQILEARQLAQQNDAEDEPPSTEEITALHSHFKRAWWRRIWIIQEAGVSSRILILCGSQSIDWWTYYFGFLVTQKLRRVARLGPAYYRNLVLMSRTRSSIHSQADDRFKDQIPDLELLPLLQAYRGYFATDPRDKVFALFGITSTNLSSLDLSINYSLSAEQIYIDVATTLLKNSSQLDILSIPHGLSLDLPPSLPSWVPNWDDNTTKPYPLAGDQNAANASMSVNPLRIFTASSTSTSSISFSNSGHNLHLRGYKISTIIALAQPVKISMEDLQMPLMIGSLEDPTAMLDLLTKFFSVFKSLCSTMEEWKSLAMIQDNTITEEFARTLWADLNLKNCREDCEAWLSKLESFGEIINELPSFELQNSDSEEELMALAVKLMPVIGKFDLDDMSKLRDVVCVHIFSRRLAKLDGEGLGLGLVPEEAEVGDQIVLLQGGSTPFVLREKREGKWSLVGECFVNGVMYGEIWDETRCEEIVVV
ncbi:hypothetical protein HII31_01953 [Pseudocercospora fuligena]|uniref:ZZ-type domain-containing protein n=1 Tax=Pseudocercospora fuligena TaxID=685502 RepID=A0A8H6RTG1_9PEZI|nr:hypothetical protein HII31_01953 [Pseudocercospora fuligena]